MTSIVVVLWLIGHAHSPVHFSWAFWTAATSCMLDYTASLLCIAEFRLRGNQHRSIWNSSMERLATQHLEAEAAAGSVTAAVEVSQIEMSEIVEVETETTVIFKKEEIHSELLDIEADATEPYKGEIEAT